MLEEEGINVEANKESLCFAVKLVALKQAGVGSQSRDPYKPKRCSEKKVPERNA
jgi:hypothetical protein